MATLPNATYSAPGVPLYGKGGAGNLTSSMLILVDGSTSSILEAYPGAARWQYLSNGSVVTEIRQDGLTQGIILDTGASETAFEASTIRTNAQFFSAPQITVSTLNANYVGATEVDTSTISTSVLDIDGQLLTATPSNLLLNGIPIATTSNISSLADWALEPAISSVNMSGFDLLSAGTIFAQNGVFQDISTVTFTAQSTLHVISTISSSVLEGELGVFSSLQAGTISTPALFVSSINGAEFTSTAINVQVAGVSSLVANSISSIGAELRTALVSTLQFNPSFSPNLDVNLGLGSLFGNLAGAAAGGLGVLVGTAALGTGIAALTQGRQTNTINSNAYELVNGTTQLQISTLGTSFSTVYRFVSSVSENVPGEEIFVSTVYPPGVAIRSLSDPLNTVSAPTSTIQSFGQWVSLDANVPAISTVSSFQQLFTSSLTASTVVTENGASVRGGAPFLNSPSGNSSLEVFLSSSPEYSAPIRVNQINFSYAGLTSNDYAGDVILTNYAGGANPPRLAVFNGSVGNAQIAYLSDIPGITSSFVYLFTQYLDVSSINFPGLPGTGISGDDAFTVIQGINNLIAKTSEFSTVQGEAGGNLQITTPATAPVLNASTVNASTVVVQGQVIIEPSTLRSGVYMPFDATNGTGVVAVGLSTGSVFNKYSALLGAQGAALGAATNEMFTLLQTNDAEVSFQYADLQLGRALFNGSNNYGTYTSGYITGDGAGNLSAVASNVNCSNLTVSSVRGNVGTLSTLTISGVSSVSFSTAGAAGAQSQPASRLIIAGQDVDLGQNDLWAQQVRIGAGNPTNSQSELIFYDANANVRGLNTGLQDRTIRVVSTINSQTGGYLLDTAINPPFFSTINSGTSTALFAFFPSTTNSTIGVSTLSVIPNPIFVAQTLSLSSQRVLAPNTPLALNLGAFDVNVGAYTVQNSTLTVPVAGTYTFSPSLQFNTTTGGAQTADFWFTKNGSNIPNSASKISVANNAQTIGTVVFQNTAAAGDQYGIAIASSDANMEVGFFQSTIAPYTRPAIPSIILNAQRVA